MNSIWHDTAQHQTKAPLEKKITTEIAVIGGGLTGVLTADALAAEGKRVVILDASATGSGQTGRTTAKVTAQHGDIYHRIESSRGADAAYQYAQANQHAISAYRELIGKRHIRCSWEDVDACLYSIDDSPTLLTEAKAQQRAGLNARLCIDHDLPLQAKVVLRLAGQGQFHPLQLLYALSDDLTIYENSRVIGIDGNRIETEHGEVQAEHIVFACHYPFVILPGAYFARMHQERSYVLALTNTPQLSSHYYCIDSGGLSLRQAGKYLLLGGGNHRTGECSSDPYEALRRSAALLFPHSTEAAHWSAQDCMTLDGVPYIGRFSPSKPNWYVATGFGKWGMSSAMVAAQILRDLIMGRTPHYASVFSPRRISLSPTAMVDEGVHAVRGLTRQLFSSAHALAQTLPPDHGGVVDLNGQKAGLYKSKSGEIWVVDVRCPHLGCQLSWNQAEKSWDCPCHGSRYDYKGHSLDGPAQKSLTAHRLR